MAGIKLGRLADRGSSKLTVTISSRLHEGLRDYAAFYAASYGSEAPLSELVPAILETFLEGDRAFATARKKGLGGGSG